MNLKNGRLGLNAKCEIAMFRLIVSDLLIYDKQNKVVSFIYVLTSNEEISKIKKTHL